MYFLLYGNNDVIRLRTHGEKVRLKRKKITLFNNYFRPTPQEPAFFNHKTFL